MIVKHGGPEHIVPVRCNICGRETMVIIPGDKYWCENDHCGTNGRLPTDPDDKEMEINRRFRRYYVRHLEAKVRRLEGCPLHYDIPVEPEPDTRSRFRKIWDHYLTAPAIGTANALIGINSDNHLLIALGWCILGASLGRSLYQNRRTN